MALKIKRGTATSPTTEANATTVTIPDWAVGNAIRIMKLEGIPFVNGQPNPTVEQLRQLKQTLRIEDVILE